ncbi:hypothetical protein BX264_2388 [Streptomyces sp. 2333.5]|uniref:hypothetical protein n=1 Tax=Streptomyces TaxID=1883 RepID=UPI000896611F|nr:MULTISPECIES: hypothetical protein [unclassified Streptomyces]PJJ02058.1 hypothetical protein BX264_2388 [Streptomyces sp. 2333.5]SEC93620.1 hypothetical protein SAMN05428943_2526 [Streptomyces sp. 2314.4]SED79375.1 hypothetical protein SAMN05428942_2490 [Streptomyces sp. 2112.2]
MPITDPTPVDETPLHVEVVRDGVPTPLDADEIRVTLPNGIVVHLSRGQDPAGSVVAQIPSEGPDADTFSHFLVRPGAANLLFLNAERHARRTAEGGG